MGVRGNPAVELVDDSTVLPALARLTGHLFWRAAARVDQALDHFRPEGFDIYAYATLLALADVEPRSQQEIADSIGASRTTTARVAAELQTAGLVGRVRNPADRRSYSLSRTDAGVAAAEAWRPYADQLEQRLTEGMAPEDVAELRRLLRRAAAPGLSPGTPEPLGRSIGFLVHQVHLRMHPGFLDALRPLGIEPRHFGSLVVLQQVGPLPQHELARAMGVSGASIVAIVDDLEARGLVERRRDETDRRAQLLTLRPEAPQVVKRAKALSSRLHAEQLAELTPAEVDRLNQLLTELVSTR